MASELHTIMEKLDKLNANIRRNNELLVTRLERLEMAHATETSELRRLMQVLGTKIDDLENRKGRNNLVFYGLEEMERESWEQSEQIVLDFVKDCLLLQLEPNS